MKADSVPKTERPTIEPTWHLGDMSNLTVVALEEFPVTRVASGVLELLQAVHLLSTLTFEVLVESTVVVTLSTEHEPQTAVAGPNKGDVLVDVLVRRHRSALGHAVLDGREWGTLGDLNRIS